MIVDAISGLGSDEFEPDKWGVDVTVGGSQKGLMIPPGLAFCAVSQKAWDLVKKSTLPRFYYDLNKYNKLVGEGDSPWTPAISLVMGLGKALSMVTEEGVDKFIRRHQEDAGYVRKSVTDSGLKLFSKFPSDAVTAISTPEGVDAGNIIKAMKSRGITFAPGQGELKGKIFRIAHMGAITRKDLEYALGTLKEVFKEQNIKV